ncbi:hypothetical protein [Croceicoccus naphthovorans]|uniref:Uncharacterized protein n=1 Tax=Croceicoccus naphthovorans TaxID=1348774 RepID=A0A0G3XJH1_9SPHN|nr:hypothetical protein [Croceicoccus naphthovorans]AKM10771.1 hypothetical protein AB433_13645 [Croceicoccus naphthovorans]MBB3988970.1 hypothetical protein [Croceicoccus naphthovorans]
MTIQPADPAAIIAPGTSFALSGPSKEVDEARLPVRGDLAHIRLAGEVFVPHYAVPLGYRTTQPTQLVAAARPDAATITQIDAGTAFDVLDIAGKWAWGAVAGDGLVGYVALDAIERIEA